MSSDDEDSDFYDECVDLGSQLLRDRERRAAGPAVGASSASTGESTIVGQSAPSDTHSDPDVAWISQAAFGGGEPPSDDEVEEDGFSSVPSTPRPSSSKAPRALPPPPPMRTCVDVMNRLKLDRSIMGHSTHAECPSFCAGSGLWVEATQVVTLSGKAPMPARVLALNIPLEVLDRNASTLSDFSSENVENPSAGARARLVATMVGLISASTSKGYPSGRNHTAEDASDKEREKIKNVSEHLFKPFSKAADDKREFTAPQFTFSLEELLDEGGQRVVALRLWITIYDPTFSFSSLVGKLINESSLMHRSSLASSMEEATRKTNLVKAQTLYQSVIGGDLSDGCTLQYKTVRSLTSLADVYHRLGTGASGVAAPYVDDWSTFPSPSANPTINEDCCYGPDFILNVRRSGLVLSAGLLDGNGQRIAIHPDQMLVSSYLGLDRRFQPAPATLARDRSLVYTCADAAETSLWSLRLPPSFRTGATPSQALLSIVYDLRCDSSPTLLKAAEQGRLSVDLLQKELVSEFEAIALKKDPELLAIERSLESGRVDADSIDVMRSMGGGLTASVSRSGGYFISPRLSIKDAAEESNRVFEALQTFNEREAAKQPRCARGRRTELKLARLGRVRAARRDLLLLTVEKFFDCFGSRRQTAGVPPGYLDIMRGFRDTMREVAALATHKTIDHTNATAVECHGSLALGMAFGTRHLASDLSPFGVWQAFLGDLFSNVSGVSGDTSCMHTLHLQSMEVAWSASSYMLIHSAQGLGKSVRLAKIKRLHVEGWVMSSGDGSACAGANGGLEYTCGRLLTFDEIPKSFYSKDSEQIEKLKSAATDNFVSTQRTAKVAVGRGGGAESFKTVHMTPHRMSKCLGLRPRSEAALRQAAAGLSSHEVDYFAAFLQDASHGDLGHGDQRGALSEQGSRRARWRQDSTDRPLPLSHGVCSRVRGPPDRRGMARLVGTAAEPHQACQVPPGLVSHLCDSHAAQALAVVGAGPRLRQGGVLTPGPHRRVALQPASPVAAQDRQAELYAAAPDGRVGRRLSSVVGRGDQGLHALPGPAAPRPL